MQGAQEDADDQEFRIYEELHRYLSAKAYPIGCTKAERAVIRKRAKMFELVGGVLHYKDERDGESILRQVISFELSQYCRSTSVFNKTFNNLIIILIHIPLCICVI